MHRRTARTNRVALAVVGLLLVAVGGCLIAGYAGAFGAADPLYTPAEQRWLHSHAWLWIVVAIGSAVVGLLALRWLHLQTRVATIVSIDIDPGSVGGRSRLDADVLCAAIEDDVAAHPGVQSVRADLTGTAAAPRLVLRIAASADANLPDVLRHVSSVAIPAALVALDRERLPTRVRVRTTLRGDAEQPGQVR